MAEDGKDARCTRAYVNAQCVRIVAVLIQRMEMQDLMNPVQIADSQGDSRSQVRIGHVPLNSEVILKQRFCQHSRE